MLKSPASPPLRRFGARRPAVPLALSSPLLLLLAMVGLFMRSGSSRWETIPALLIAIGLLITSLWRRRHRRQEMLRSLARLRQGSI